MATSGPSKGEAELGGEGEGDRPWAMSAGWRGGGLGPGLPKTTMFQHGDQRNMSILNPNLTF